MIRLAVIGFGYWGPNIVRNFKSLDEVSIAGISDVNESCLARARKMYPDVPGICNCDNLVASPDVDAVVIVTPVSTHFELAKKALENGKHVFIEKPFTASVQEAEQLVELAERKNLKVMVDHTFLFTKAVNKIKELIEDGTLGELYYYEAIRVNLGLFQHDVNVIWDLAPHDLSVLDFLVSRQPVAVTANGIAHVNGQEDVAYLTLYYPSKFIAHVTVNWLSPVKIRSTIIGGKEKMLEWNDMMADEKIRVYDRGVDVTTKEGEYDLRINYRSGDMWIPRVEQTEALRVEAEYFIRCIRDDLTPLNDAMSGLRVVKLLEAATRSLRQSGKLIYIDSDHERGHQWSNFFASPRMSSSAAT